MTMHKRAGIFTVISSVLGLLTITGAGSAQQAGTRVRTLELFLQRYGFAAKTVHVPPGPLRIVVNNRTGMQQMRVRLEDANAKPGAAAIKDQVVSLSTRVAWSYEVNLQPGEYVLQETTQGLWKCRLIVAAK